MKSNELIFRRVLIFGVIGLLFGGIQGALLGMFLAYLWSVLKGGGFWGGVLGFMFAGPLGAIAGAYFGSSISKMPRGSLNDRSVFEINLISILAYIAKVDGQVHQDEVKVIIENIGVRSLNIAQFQRTLSFALQQNIDLRQTCLNFKKISKYEERLILLRLVYLVVVADGVIHKYEKMAIEKIVDYLGISSQDYLSLQGEFSQTADKYYRILGLNADATKQEIRKSYRKLALTHHPDRVAHLGDEYKKNAKETFQKINEAYSKLMAET